jgi:hypothetical protein
MRRDRRFFCALGDCQGVGRLFLIGLDTDSMLPQSWTRMKWGEGPASPIHPEQQAEEEAWDSHCSLGFGQPAGREVGKRVHDTSLMKTAGLRLPSSAGLSTFALETDGASGTGRRFLPAGSGTPHDDCVSPSLSLTTALLPRRARVLFTVAPDDGGTNGEPLIESDALPSLAAAALNASGDARGTVDVIPAGKSRGTAG